MRDEHAAAIGYAPSGANFKPSAIQVPALTAALDRIEKTLAAAHERAETAALAVGRISIADPTPVGPSRSQAQCAPSTVETRLHEVADGVDALLGKLEIIAKRLNALV